LFHEQVSADFLQYDNIDFITATTVGFHDDDFGASTCGNDGFRARCVAIRKLPNMDIKVLIRTNLRL
jgi:hypothetical protein